MSSNTSTPQHNLPTPAAPQESPRTMISLDIKPGLDGGSVEGVADHLGTENIADNVDKQTLYQGAKGVKFIGGLSAANSSSLVEKYNDRQAQIQEKRLEYEFKLKEQQQQFEQQMEMRRAELALRQPAEQVVKQPAPQKMEERAALTQKRGIC